MVTQETEGGKVKCHRYWPDTIGAPFTVSNRYCVIIKHQVMSSHLSSDGIHLASHNGEVSIDKGHEGQILVGGWLPIWCENKPMRPYNLLNCCGVSSPELARGYP